MNTKRTIFKNLIFIFIVGIFIFLFNLNSTAQELSFTVSSTTLTESGITITNTSNSIPIGYRFRWEVSGGAIYCDSIGRQENSFEKNNSTFIIYPVTKLNADAETITLTLKLMNQAGVIQSTTPNSASLTYNPLTLLAGNCTAIGNIPCNIVCNSGFEVNTPVTGGKQLDRATSWSSGYFDGSSIANLGLDAELFTYNNGIPAWSSTGNAPNYFGTQAPTTIPSNYAGFVAKGSYNREYIANELSTQLIANNTYTVNFDYSLAEASAFGTNFKVVIFYAAALTSTNINSAVNGLPVTEISPNNANQVDPTNWHSFTGTFTAPSTGDAYLLIMGANTTLTTSFSPSTSFNLAYYYIDNVTMISSLAETATVSLPTTLTPCFFPYTVTATSSPALPANAIITWKRNGVILQNANTLNLTVTQNGTYTLSVTLCGTTLPPMDVIVTKQSPDVTVSTSNPCQLPITITATCTGYTNNLIYKWINPSNAIIAGANSNTLSVNSGFGTYNLVVDPQNGCAQYFPINVVYNGLEGTVNNTSITCGNSTTLTVSNPANVSSYQWYKNGAAIGGANSASYNTGILYATTNYTVTLSNSSGCPPITLYSTVTVTGQVFVPTLEPEEISQHIVNLPGNFSYVVENPDPNSTYVWQIITGNGTPSSASGTSININWSVPNSNLIGEVRLTRYLNNCTYGTQIYKVFNHPTNICGEVGLTTRKTEWNIINQTEVNKITDGYWYLEGVTTISTNITINNSQPLIAIFMAPNAKIIIMPNCTLTITDITINGCYAMWDNIYLSSPTAKIVFTNSELNDAINGIVARNGAQLSITGSSFKNNYISIKLRDYAKATPNATNLPAYPATIIDNTFDKTTMLYPYSNSNAFTGIYTYNVENLTIGAGGSGQNIFRNLLNGIFVKASTIRIVNNKFQNITDNSVAPPWPQVKPTYAAINVQYTNAVMNGRPVQIGTSSINNKNIFLNCTKGIYSNDNTVQIEYNDFKDCVNGVMINKFNNNTYVNTNNFVDNSTCINIQPPTGTSFSNFKVENNIISGSMGDPSIGTTKVFTGIMLYNLNGGINNYASIKNNYITFDGANSSAKYGVRMSNCTYFDVACNNIKHLNSPTLVGSSKVYGISADNIKYGSIRDNNLSYLGNGLRGSGDLNLTSFKCNYFNMNMFGIYFQNATISQQGNSNQSPDNTFTLPNVSNTKKISGTLVNPPVKWYHKFKENAKDPRTFGGSFWDIINPIVDYDIDASVYVPGAQTMCSICNSSPNGNSPTPLGLLDDPNLIPEERDDALQQLLEGVDYDIYEEGYQTFDNQILFEILDNNPDLMFLEGENDQEYIDFYNIQKNANIGRFADVNLLIQEGNYESATEINQNLTAENEIFEYLKTVNSIYLDSWCKDRYLFTEEEVETLTNIAMMTPNEAGNAAYTARILLGIDPVLNEQVSYKLEGQSPENGKSPNLLLYPNPTQGQLQLDILNGIELENATFNIYNSMGKLVYSNNFSTKYYMANFSVENLKNGLYLYIIKSADGNIFTGKISILK